MKRLVLVREARGGGVPLSDWGALEQTGLCAPGHISYHAPVVTVDQAGLIPKITLCRV